MAATKRSVSSFLIEAKANVKSVEGYGAPGKGNTFDRSTYYEPSYIIMSSLFRHRGGWDRKIVALEKGLELGMNLIDTAEKYQTEDVAIL